MIMIHARSIRPHKLRKNSQRHTWWHTYVLSNLNVTSRATHFAVSVPAEEFILAQPNNYICAEMKS
jgi:hypothetical protein